MQHRPIRETLNRIVHKHMPICVLVCFSDMPRSSLQKYDRIVHDVHTFV